MRIFTRLACVCVLFSASLSASASVIVGGNTWLQPNSFTNLSWNEIAAVCNSTTGLCDGELNGVNVTGQTWASVDEVNTLFNSYLPDTSQLGPGIDDALISSTTSADSFFVDFFPTVTAGAITSSQGWARNAFRGDNNAMFAYEPIFQRFARAPIFESLANTGLFELTSESSSSVGAWLFTKAPVTPTPVPEPSILVLLSLGLAGLGLTRYRRKRQAGL